MAAHHDNPPEEGADEDKVLPSPLLHSARSTQRASAATERATVRYAGLEALGTAPLLGTFLDWWMAQVAGPTLKLSTSITYRHVIDSYIVPHIGTTVLARLTPDHVAKMLDGLSEKGLSTSTQRAAHSVLRRALRFAQVEGMVTNNAAASIETVVTAPAHARAMTTAQARQFLNHVRDDRLFAAFGTILGLGLRRGEMHALTWLDIDLDSRRPTLRVGRSLQRLPGVGLVLSGVPAGETRLLAAPQFVADGLRQHRRRQQIEARAAGDEWVPLPLDADLVFRTEVGNAIDPANFKQRTHRLSEAAGIGRWGPHELRHSAAAILLESGVSLEVVSKTLGHSSVRTTADIYGHLLDAHNDAASAAQRALFG